MSFSAEISAGCKINLRLKVTSRRPDGYHELDTVFLPLALPADRITVAPGQAGVEFHCAAFPDVDGNANLAVKAAAAYAEAAGIDAAWRIELEKNIPLAAGLGGGSSDAAAVLTMLNGQYRMFNEMQLAEIAVKLGADVPFFLHRRPVRATGIGEKFTPFEIPGKLPEILVVNPGFPVSAKWAYQNLKAEYIGTGKSFSPDDYARAFAAPETADWQELVRNDLAFAIFEKFPLTVMLKEFLLENGAYCAQISGSGPSLFAFFPGKTAAVAAARSLRTSQLGTVTTRIFAGGMEF